MFHLRLLTLIIRRGLNTNGNGTPVSVSCIGQGGINKNRMADKTKKVASMLEVRWLIKISLKIVFNQLVRNKNLRRQNRILAKIVGGNLLNKIITKVTLFSRF